MTWSPEVYSELNNSKASFSGSVNFINKDCVQQTNGHDCGVHLILNAERLAEWAINQGVIGMCDVEVQVSATTKRKEILKIIQTLASDP